MTIGTPKDLGGSSVPTSTQNNTVTVGQADTANDMVLAFLASGNTVSTPTGVTAATPTLTFRSISNYPGTNGRCLYIYGLENAAQVTTSTVITGAWSGTGNTKNMRCVSVGGLATSSADDAAAAVSAIGTGANPSATTGPLAQGTEIVFAVVDCGLAGTSIDWAGSGFTEIGSDLHTGSGDYLSVAYKIVSTADAVTAQATLGASAAWAITVIPFKGAAAGGSVTITTSSLGGATRGAAYTARLDATTNNPPITLWDISSGALPSGLAIAGLSGAAGEFKPITYAGVSPSGSSDTTSGSGVAAPDVNDWNYAQSQIGPGMRVSKIFQTSWGGSGGVLPSSWANSGMAKAMCDADPGSVPILVWDTPMSSTALRAFLSSIPAGQVVGLNFGSEPEGSGTAATYVANFKNQADIVHGFGNPNLLMATSAYIYQYRAGGLASALNGDWIPDPQYVDVYGCDVYQRQGSSSGAWPSQGLANYVAFQNWFTKVKGLGKPIGFCEYGIDACGTEAARNARLQMDWAWIKNNFGPGKSASPFALAWWVWWWRWMAGSQSPCYYSLRFAPGSVTADTWKALVASAGVSGGGGSTSAQISGVCTQAPGTVNFTVRATDANSQQGTKALSIVVSGGTLAIDTPALPGGTLNSPYQGAMAGSGGTGGFVWTLDGTSAALPSGVSLNTDGTWTGTPTAAGTFPDIVIRLTDSSSAYVTATFSMTIAGTFSITTLTVPAAIAGTAYDSGLLATAGGQPPISWALGDTDLPAGFILDPDEGSFSGTTAEPGAYPIVLVASDSSGKTATASVTLTVSPATGALPDLGRRLYGGTMADWVITFVGDAVDRAAGIAVTFWNDEISGVQYTDLQTPTGVPIDHVVTDGNGAWDQFYGPPEILAMWADANGGAGPRRKVMCNDLPDLVFAIYAALRGQGSG